MDVEQLRLSSDMLRSLANLHYVLLPLQDSSPTCFAGLSKLDGARHMQTLYGTIDEIFRYLSMYRSNQTGQPAQATEVPNVAAIPADALTAQEAAMLDGKRKTQYVKSLRPTSNVRDHLKGFASTVGDSCPDIAPRTICSYGNAWNRQGAVSCTYSGRSRAFAVIRPRLTAQVVD
jgi:hypothetical protein